MTELLYRQLSGQIIDASIQVHHELGSGLLESAYEACLCHLLSQRGLACQRQVSLPIHFQAIQVDAGYRIDLLVDRKIIVELKAVDHVQAIHEAQLMTYLRLSGYRVGLLINFNVIRLKDGVKRFVV